MGIKVARRSPTPRLAPAAVSAPEPVVGFENIWLRAAARKGEDELIELLPEPKSDAELRALPEDRFLSVMGRCIFSAGFVWKVVDAKWPQFEEAFHGFDVERIAGFDEGDIDALATDTRVIRHRPKLAAMRDNARFILDARAEFGGFGGFLAEWPDDDIVGLWGELKSRGNRLGGFSGPMFLRFVGKDTFMLTADVIKALVGAGVVAKAPTSKRDLAATQAAFNVWRAETGRPLCQLSRILACSVD